MHENLNHICLFFSIYVSFHTVLFMLCNAFSFAVGGDGLAYEGRGWTTVGAHAAPQNSRSIGIVLIGNWSSKYRFKK